MYLHIQFVLLGFAFNSALAHNLTVNEILEFQSSEELERSFPYYLSGYDDEGAPIWVTELGKWDFRKFVEVGGEMFNTLDIYFDQLLYRMRESALNSKAKQFISIGDLDGFDLRQAGHFGTIQFLLSKFIKVEKVISEGRLKKAIVLNSNFLFENIWHLGKPLLGNLANSVVIFGANRKVWKPKLLRDIPKDQIPEWYGGSKDHRPVKVFG